MINPQTKIANQVLKQTGLSVEVISQLNFLFSILNIKLGIKLNKRENNFISPINRAKIYSRDGFACAYCGNTKNLSIDHIVPQMVRFDHSATNLITACKSCNSSKKHKSLKTFIGYLNNKGRNKLNITAASIMKQASQ